MLRGIVRKNLLFYWQKVTLTVLLIGFLLFLSFASWIFTQRIQELADLPLDSLSTEIVLQQDTSAKDASSVKTTGVIQPFAMQSFQKKDTKDKLSSISNVEEVSTALILWQFDLQNNKIIVGLDVDDPKIGLRKVEDQLTPQSAFFNNNGSDEVILERHFARLFGYQLGGTYPIEGAAFTVIGIVDFEEQTNLANAQIFMPYDTALRLIESESSVINQVFLSLNEASQLSNVQEQVEDQFPEFSIITKDKLLKNLSSFNQLIYNFGQYFIFGISVLSGVLIFWILKINRLEFKAQNEVLTAIGWPQKSLMNWRITENVYILSAALVVSIILITILNWAILPHIEIGTPLNQDFQL